MNTTEINIFSHYDLFIQVDKSTLIPMTEKQIAKTNQSILETEALLEKCTKKLNGYLGTSMEAEIVNQIEFCKSHIKKLQFMIEFGTIDIWKK